MVLSVHWFSDGPEMLENDFSRSWKLYLSSSIDSFLPPKSQLETFYLCWKFPLKNKQLVCCWRPRDQKYQQVLSVMTCLGAQTPISLALLVPFFHQGANHLRFIRWDICFCFLWNKCSSSGFEFLLAKKCKSSISEDTFWYNCEFFCQGLKKWCGELNDSFIEQFSFSIVFDV